ncbi:Os11g0697001 [Oryza sativa Japonica Group]|uniref:Os11g0697001 protein n=1 Tax=Oryza sativa subsp. japonica TaxID=39947 RepID=A0A0N7KTE0_ORYSJ|nr:hypothetical protein EE612_057136 [Oryza sativa]BAT15354.1 Os11g0697001 [Oryza sativa Japonica Group]
MPTTVRRCPETAKNMSLVSPALMTWSRYVLPCSTATLKVSSLEQGNMSPGWPLIVFASDGLTSSPMRFISSSRWFTSFFHHSPAKPIEIISSDQTVIRSIYTCIKQAN